MLVEQLCFPVAGLDMGYPLRRYPLASKIYIWLNKPPLQISKYICIIELRMVFHSVVEIHPPTLQHHALRYYYRPPDFNISRRKYMYL